MYTLGQYFR